MKTTRPSFIGGCLILLFFLVGSLNYVSAEPSVALATADPSTILLGIPTSIVISARIEDPNLIPSSVNVQKLDANNKVTSILGYLQDNGLNGDRIAGDKVFSQRFTITGSTLGQIRLRVSAAFKGLLTRKFSDTIIIAVTVLCYQELPTPSLVFKGTKDYIGSDCREYTMYNLGVTNRSSFPNELFQPANLPPCPSRTWVYIFDNSGNYIYGFCGLRSSADLDSIWFGLLRGTIPPESVYIQIIDRQCQITYTSNYALILTPPKWFEGWESMMLGYPACENDPGFSNCAFWGDSGIWHATVYHPEDLNVGDPMEYLEVISTNSGKQLKIRTSNDPRAETGVLNGYLWIPVTEETEIFFEGHEALLSDPTAYISIELRYGGDFQLGDPCKSKIITYVFENNSLPVSTDWRKVIVIGPTLSFRRKIFQDLQCSPSEFVIGRIDIFINGATSGNNWTTWDSIGFLN